MREHVEWYVQIPKEYCRFLGGLRWCPSGRAIEYDSGTTFAVAEAVALFLEGFAGSRPLVHFAHLLHLLDLLRGNNPHRPRPGSLRLRDTFLRAGGSHRNAGAFAAVLCPVRAAIASTPEARDVCQRLRNPFVPMHWDAGSFSEPPLCEEPPLAPDAFEHEVLQALTATSEEDLWSWFRNGHGPLRQAGEALARQWQRPAPRALREVVRDLLERPRLAGAAPFLAQLVSALSLPPRRLQRQELAVGGYADLHGHGQPDQILYGQFALDEWEFLRRFAERELLYYRREEPPPRHREELVILLDQGVRTWGEVRLVLCAAALALARQAGQRKLSLSLATTASDGLPLDPGTADPETLGQLLEASDLSANPGLALGRLLERPQSPGRDIVLLTHPRNLREDTVLAATRRAAASDRLFALAVDAERNAELVELRRGGLVRVREFRVEGSPTVPAVELPQEEKRERLAPWEGDVEPVGFPFRLGVATAIHREHFAFDASGQRLMAVDARGVPYTWSVDGKDSEILPRLRWEGSPLKAVRAVVGVAGGFVVVGSLRSTVVAAHYDFERRRCLRYLLGSDAANWQWQWYYARAQHTFVSYSQRHQRGFAVDLATGEQTTTEQPRGAARADKALRLAEQGMLPGRFLKIVDWSDERRTRFSFRLNPTLGECFFLDGNLNGLSSRAVADGKPLLEGCIPESAQFRGGTLVLQVWPSPPRQRRLQLFRIPGFLPLQEFHDLTVFPGWVLSDDGCRLAIRRSHSRIEVVSLKNPRLLLKTRVGGIPQAPSVRLGNSWLRIASGKRWAYLLRWDSGSLKITQEIPTREAGFTKPADHAAGVEAIETRSLPDWATYDPQRFKRVARHGLVAVLDCYGQVILADKSGALVCQVFAFRGMLGVWMPDGTRSGPASLTGGPPTPDALPRIGRALQEACKRGEAWGFPSV